jgi:hypothetical protein
MSVAAHIPEKHTLILACEDSDLGKKDKGNLNLMKLTGQAMRV